jgi:branched-chain amino acid transport system substrate-binding protein
MRIAFGKYPGRSTALALVAVVVACAFAGCGSGGRKDDRAQGSTLTVYTSLPRHGVSAREADAVAAGERLALADAHGRAGGRQIRLVELDDSAPQGGVTWNAGVVEANAKRAAKDPTTIAYIGELSFGGSAISVPVTNSKGILEVSPGDGLTSLTEIQPGGPKTSPVRYYPNGRRTFVRLVPNDLKQVEALLSVIRAQGADSVALVHDDRLFGREMAAQATAAASDHDIHVSDVQEAHGSNDYSGLAGKIASRDPDVVAYLGVGGARTDLLLRQLADALPGVRLYATSGLADSPPPAGAGVPPLDLVDPVFPAAAYGRKGRRVLARLGIEMGVPVPAEALYGYEAMKLVLDSLNSAGSRSNDRDVVTAAALGRQAPHSVLGPYSITRTGDVLPTRFAAYRLSGGRLDYRGALGGSLQASRP